MGTKWEQSGNKNLKVGPEWGQSGNKNLKVGQEWEQSGNKNRKVGQEWEQSGNKDLGKSPALASWRSQVPTTVVGLVPISVVDIHIIWQLPP